MLIGLGRMERGCLKHLTLGMLLAIPRTDDVLMVQSFPYGLYTIREEPLFKNVSGIIPNFSVAVLVFWRRRLFSSDGSSPVWVSCAKRSY